MLVLSRKLTEQIVIGDDIVVTVLGIRAGRVRIGIEAPKETHVLRSELRNLAPVVPVSPGDFAIAASALVQS